jgi:hypothetical protein
MKHCKCTRLVVLTASLFLLIASAALSDDVYPVDRSMGPQEVENAPFEPVQPVLNSEGRQAYEAELRLYVVEPDSRWKAVDNKIYNNGFLNYALDTYITMNSGDRERWSGSFTYAGLTGSNVKVIAVLTDPAPQATNYSSYPPHTTTQQYPFTPFYVDAACEAEAGHADSNKTTATSTHTVFVEEGTATWCPSCPSARDVLYSLHHNSNYNFHYAAMIVDVNTVADDRMDDFNLHWLPTCYGDGGYEVAVGSSEILGMITSSEQRTVNDVGLLVGVEWNDAKGGIDIELAYSHETPVNTMITEMAAPTGDVEVLPGTSHDYTCSATDAEGDEFYYKYDWGDGVISDWLGPYNSGEDCILPYSWSEMGTYNVMVKAKDVWNFETSWSPVTEVEVFCCLVRGDAKHDNQLILVDDIVYLVDHLFKGGPAPVCPEEGDAKADNGLILVDDIVYLVDHLFKGGPAPSDC